jgi:hypothetical protein
MIRVSMFNTSIEDLAEKIRGRNTEENIGENVSTENNVRWNIIRRKVGDIVNGDHGPGNNGKQKQIPICIVHIILKDEINVGRNKGQEENKETYGLRYDWVTASKIDTIRHAGEDRPTTKKEPLKRRKDNRKIAKKNFWPSLLPVGTYCMVTFCPLKDDVYASILEINSWESKE